MEGDFGVAWGLEGDLGFAWGVEGNLGVACGLEDDLVSEVEDLISDFDDLVSTDEGSLASAIEGVTGGITGVLWETGLASGVWVSGDLLVLLGECEGRGGCLGAVRGPHLWVLFVLLWPRLGLPFFLLRVRTSFSGVPRGLPVGEGVCESVGGGERLLHACGDRRR